LSDICVYLAVTVYNNVMSAVCMCTSTFHYARGVHINWYQWSAWYQLSAWYQCSVAMITVHLYDSFKDQINV